MRPSKTVRESQHETSELMMPQHANNLGNVFGGVVLSMMDKCAAIAAFRHCRANVVTASIDRVDFREPIHVGDHVVLKAAVNYVGHTSMEVGVRVIRAHAQFKDARTVTAGDFHRHPAAGVNIGAMQVGRDEEGGEALMALTVDVPLDAALLGRIKEFAAMDDAWYVQL